MRFNLGEQHGQQSPIDRFKEGQMAEFEWDPKKESLNFKKHGFDFTSATEIWDGSVAD